MKFFLSGIFLGSVLLMPFSLSAILGIFLMVFYRNYWFPLPIIFVLEVLLQGRNHSYLDINFFYTITGLIIFAAMTYVNDYIWRNEDHF